jgi:hypothetical protein
MISLHRFQDISERRYQKFFLELLVQYSHLGTYGVAEVDNGTAPWGGQTIFCFNGI